MSCRRSFLLILILILCRHFYPSLFFLNPHLLLTTDGYTTEDLVFLWKEGDPVQVTKTLHLPRFTLQKFKTEYCTSRTNTGMCLSSRITSLVVLSFDQKSRENNFSSSHILTIFFEEKIFFSFTVFLLKPLISKTSIEFWCKKSS